MGDRSIFVDLWLQIGYDFIDGMNQPCWDDTRVKNLVTETRLI